MTRLCQALKRSTAQWWRRASRTIPTELTRTFLPSPPFLSAYPVLICKEWSAPRQLHQSFGLHDRAQWQNYGIQTRGLHEKKEKSTSKNTMASLRGTCLKLQNSTPSLYVTRSSTCRGIGRRTWTRSSILSTGIVLPSVVHPDNISNECLNHRKHNLMIENK